MFRVVGRDAQGRKKELSVSAATDEEARAIALGAGIVTIDRVGAPSPFEGGCAVGILGSLWCLTTTTLGVVSGAYIGDALESPGAFIRGGFLLGALVGAVLGLIFGVSTLVAGLRRFWKRRY